MYKDLSEKHKRREALINQEHKKLTLFFEFRNSALSSGGKKLIKEEKECKIASKDANVSMMLVDQKKFTFIIEFKEHDFELLNKIFRILAYILGRNLKLEFFRDSFPFYTEEIFHNINAQSPVSKNVFKSLLEDPEKTINFFLNLLEDKKSYFRKLAIPMIDINAIQFIDVSFVFEYGLLEKISSGNSLSGKIIEDESSKEYRVLETFSEDSLRLLRERMEEANTDEKIIIRLGEKLKTKELNRRGISKEKIKIFLNSFEGGKLKEYEEYVEEWNKMRQVVHGSSFTKDGDFKKEQQNIVKKLHEVLLKIIRHEIDTKLNFE